MSTGIPAATIDGILDFSVRVSSREAYVAPDRGAQGNALKTIAAVGPIRQEPKIHIDRKPDNVKSGSAVTVEWPDSAR